MSVTLEYAGEERPFRLLLGNILDIETACGKVGIGAIYKRVAMHDYRIRDIHSVVLQGLIGGGMKETEARALVDERFDLVPIQQHVNIALAVLVDAMAGDDEPGEASGDPENPIDAGAVFNSLIKVGVTPAQVRDMRLDDFRALLRAAGRTDADAAPSEEEFEAMLERFKERYGD